MIPSRARPPRHPALRRGLLVALAVALLAGALLLGLALRDRGRVEAQLSEHERALQRLVEQAEHNAVATDQVLREHALSALRRSHPAVDALLADSRSEAVRLALLRTPRGPAPGAHGAVVWDRAMGRGVLVVSPLPEVAAPASYQLLGRTRASDALEPLAKWSTAGELPFAFTAGTAWHSFEVRRTGPDEAEPVLVTADVL